MEEDEGSHENSYGGSHKNLLLSLGAFSLVIIGLIVLLILYFVLKYCVNSGRICCDWLQNKLGKSLFYDAFIRYMTESSLAFPY